MRIFLAAAVAVLYAQIAPAQADTVGAVIESFGLVGTWSNDCHRNLAKVPGYRMIFAVPPQGAPTRTTISSDGAAKTTVHTGIMAAERLSATTLKLTVKTTGGDRNGGPLATVTANTFDEVIDKPAPEILSVRGRDPLHLVRCPGE